MTEGSHRLVQALAQANGAALSSGDTRARLKATYPWFRDLMSADPDAEARIERFMNETTRVGDVGLRVMEMTGEPGDVWLMHPDMLHAPASNALDTPRLALSQFVQPKAV
jgi:hypothetical protein